MVIGPSDVSMITWVPGISRIPQTRGVPRGGGGCCPAPPRAAEGSLVGAADGVDDDVLDRDFLMPTTVCGFDVLDLVHDVHAVDDLAEDAVAHAVGGPGPVE